LDNRFGYWVWANELDMGNTHVNKEIGVALTWALFGPKKNKAKKWEKGEDEWAHLYTCKLQNNYITFTY